MIKIIITLVFLSAASLYSQAIKNTSTYRFTAGTGTLITKHGIMIGGSMSHQKHNDLFTLCFNYYSEIKPFIEPQTYLFDIGLLYGRSFKPFGNPESYHLSLSSGVGYTWGKGRGKYIHDTFLGSLYEKKNISTLGFLVEAQMFWNITDHFGIGSVFHINWNKSLPVYGAMIAFQLR